MRIFRASVGLAALTAALASAGIPALGQQKPESILPPGFEQSPAPAPAPRPSPRPAPAPVRPAAPQPDRPAPPVAVPAPPVAGPSPFALPPLPGEAPLPMSSPVATDPVTGLPIVAPPPAARYVLPLRSRRSLATVGIRPAYEKMLAPRAFGNADGRYIEALMARMNAPVASRWVSIAMRRLLMQPLTTPRRVNGADFAAERAWLLLRMGESVGARAIVQAVDTDNYTPKLYEAALQAGLATGDPAALCPLVDGAIKVSNERAWPVLRAMCVSLTNTSAVAKPLMVAAKRAANGIDLQLAQKLIGRGALRQDVSIEWAGVPSLTIWRYGLAMAAGETIPDELFDGLSPRARYWQALSPMIDPVRRAPLADAAAEQGVLSNLALVDLYGQVDAGEVQGSLANGVASDLRTAYAAPTRDARLEAMRSLWNVGKGSAPYARLILTARAAARIPVASGTANSDELIASMVSAGLDRTAARWKDAAGRGSLGWALIALVDPDSVQRYGAGDVNALSGGGARAEMFAAGLAGLGRLDPGIAAATGVDVSEGNSWIRAIERAAAEGRPGEVLILAGVGMQTPGWQGVSPTALYHIVNALRVVGLGGTARMIAAEAVTRT